MSSRQLTTSLVREAFLAYTKTGSRFAIDAFTLEELQIAHQGIGVKEQNTEYRRALRDEIENRKDGTTLQVSQETGARAVPSVDKDIARLLAVTNKLLEQQRLANIHLAHISGLDIGPDDLDIL